MIEMKDSGVEWIDKIPFNWEVRRLKDISFLYSGLTGKEGDDFSLDPDERMKPYIPFTNVLNNKEIDSKTLNYVRIDEGEVHNLVEKDDLIFLMSSEDYDSIAKSAVVTSNLGETYLNSFCKGLHITTKSLNSKFLNYLLCARPCRDALRLEAKGFTRINIKTDKITSHFIFYPSIEEQRAIADYLDKKTDEIDEHISALEKKRYAYQRLNYSLINEVVSRGLNPSTEFKDSGIECIGKTPAHWDVMRLKDTTNLYTGNSLNESEKECYGECCDVDSYTYIGSKNLGRGKSQINYDSGYHIPKSHTKFAVAHIGDTLICIEGGSAGKKFGFVEQDVCFVNKLCCATTQLHKKFSFYYFTSYIFRNQFEQQLQGMIGGVSLSKINVMSISVPPIDEQIDIADYLDKKTTEIDLNITAISKKIETYKRLKQSLIDEVVTGKRKIH